MDRSHRLGEFLRARRQQLKPNTVGINSMGQRRVPGLRREEVAMLAGLSPDYVMRLEQGRDQQPSDRVLQALAKALQLDRDATVLLFELGRPESPFRTSSPLASEDVSAELRELINGWLTIPAFVHGPRLDVLASNALARALTPLAEPGSNLLRSWFLDQENRSRYQDIHFVQTLAVAYFRSSVRSHLDDPEVVDLIEELSERSSEFREVWARHDVNSALAGEGPLYHHPLIGSVRLRYQTFAVEGAGRHKLYLVSAELGSKDADALHQLAAAVAAGTYP